MGFRWFFIVCLWVIHIAFAEEEDTHQPSKFGILNIFNKPKIPLHGLDIFHKHQIPLPGLDFLTKPKTPSTGFQINKQFVAGTPFGGGSFGFGFGIGGQFGGSPGTGVNLPPKEKPESGKPEISWEDEGKEKVGPRPNWGEEDEEQPLPETYEEKNPPKPNSYEDKDKPKSEEKKDSRPDWEGIGEIDHEKRSDDLLDSELVADGLIQPRLNRDRVKRFIESKIYHVALKKGFISNARVSKVKFRRNDNSLNLEM